METAIDFTIPVLGKANIPSPVQLSNADHDFMADYVPDDKFIINNIEVTGHECTRTFTRQELVERAGPRRKIFFDPTKVHAAVVTCGGLCPGLNDVIRSIVMYLWHGYGVRRIHGIRNGFRGFLPRYGYPAIDLTPDVVVSIHRKGGTILGSSRGGSEIPEIVDAIEQMNINMLFVIGGDGSQRGALAVAEESERRGNRLAVVGVPKTIDNDLSFVDRSFGFDTAVSEAVASVAAAHVEAHDAVNGVGIVKLMGRQSGFIAAHTALAMNDVNYVFIPEVPFDLDGEKGLLAHLKERLKRRNHAVIVVAEGAGQSLLEQTSETDASGNKKLGDIGIFVRNAIADFFAKERTEVNIKYIDPSYIIRATGTNASDAILCARLGTNAVHAAMSGRTKVLISLLNDHFVHVPIAMAVSQRNCVDPEGSLWRDVVANTGQPALMKNWCGVRSGECGVAEGSRRACRCVPPERLDELVECSQQLRTPNSPLRTTPRIRPTTE